MVWDSPIGRGESSYAARRSGSGTKTWRGTARRAARTRGSRTPRAATCWATMRARASRKGSRSVTAAPMSAAAARRTPLHLAAAFQRAAEGGMVGIGHVAAHRQALGHAGDFALGGAELLGQVEGSGLPF